MTAATVERWASYPQSALPHTYLHPGQLHVTSNRCSLTTILGSCVAVCLHDPEHGVGGMNHFLLPNASQDPATASRYGPSAMKLLLERAIALGARPHTLTARIIGGANVLAAFHDLHDHLGIRNGELARAYLGERGVRVVGEDIGGTHGRKLVFGPHDGRAWVQLIRR
jgi:chemotaxis protein CheD